MFMIADDLIVDTGSSNTWVGAGTKYKTTSTSVKTSNSVVRTSAAPHLCGNKPLGFSLVCYLRIWQFLGH